MGSLWESDAPPLHRLIAATFRFIALSEYDDAVRIGFRLRVSCGSSGQVPEGGFGDSHAIYARAIKSGIADGYLRSDVNPRHAARTMVAAVVGCRILADSFGDDAIKRLVEAWRTVLRGIATEDAYDDLIRVVNSAARKRP